MDSVTILQQLERGAGVRPTQHWLQDCLSSLQQEPTVNTNNADSLCAAIIGQIIHHDLRDVIRSRSTNEQDTTTTITSFSPSAQQLRSAIQQSTSSECNFKATLPESFQLLVQVEEFVDAASNAERRLEVFTTGNDNNNNNNNNRGPPPPPPPQSNQNSNSGHRCLKFWYSDGYATSPRDETSSRNNENRPPQDRIHQLVAMEISPLAGLGTPQYELVAGLKILLHGPITIRHGIAGWHAGNTTILGGRVPRLVEIQKEALKLAKQKAGHGVDPTIKALIWNNPNHPRGFEGEAEAEDEDEAEHESGDVPEAPPQRPVASIPPIVHQPQPTQIPLVQRMPPPTTAIPSFQQLSTTTYPSSVAVSAAPSRLPNINPYSGGGALQASSTVNNYRSEMNNRRNQSPPQLALTSAQRTSSTVTHTTDSNQSQPAPFNPYLKSSNSNNQRVTTSTTPMAWSPTHHDTGPTPASSLLSTSNLNNRITQRPKDFTVASAVSSFTPASAMVGGTPNISALAPTRNNINSTQRSTASTTATPLSSSATVASSETTSFTAAKPPTLISFQQLRDLLLRAVESEAVYRHAYGQVYAVHNMKQSGLKLYFNIEKNKSRKRKDSKKSDKYDYIMTAKFEGDSSVEKLITCRIASSILEPYFALSPGDMRKLNKEDRCKAEILVKEGGIKVHTFLLQPNCFTLSLLSTSEEFFQRPENARIVDGAHPIVKLLHHQQ